MHPSEQKAAKNTIRFGALVFNNLHIHVGEVFNPDALGLGQHPVLLYPSEKATPIEHLSQSHPVSSLIVLDGTWKKAHKLLALNPWLNHIEARAFGTVPPNRYVNRKAPRSDSLSSYEAITHALHHLEGMPLALALNAFDRFIARQMANMPDAVKARYPNGPE